MVSSVTLSNKQHSVESAKRKLNFDEPRINRMETEVTRAPIWKREKGRRLNFGETDPSLLLSCPGEQNVELDCKFWMFCLHVHG